MKWEKYSRIPNLEMMKPTPRILLGRRLLWTEKKDGSNIAIWLREVDLKKGKPPPESYFIDGKTYHIQISSRNLIEASSDLLNQVRSSEDYSKIIELLKENLQFIVYVESCRKGRSVTGTEFYDRNYLFLFDIFDRKSKKFLNYIAVHQHAYHHKIPVVKLYAETRHTSIKDLMKFVNHVLLYCKEMELEGMVIKLRKPYIKNIGFTQAKVKIDIPEPKRRKIAKGEVIYPPIPENEILGAIDKAWQELGTKKFKDIRLAMPLIAKLVKDECKKHLYSSPTKKLFIHYKKYLERLL